MSHYTDTLSSWSYSILALNNFVFLLKQLDYELEISFYRLIVDEGATRVNYLKILLVVQNFIESE